MPEVATKRAKTGWTTVAFGDVVRQVKDKVDPEESGLERYVAGEHMDTDDLRIRRWGEIGDGYLGPAFHMRFKPGHVLYGSRRTYLRKVAMADFEGITANTTYVLESADPNVLLPELLPFIMQTGAFNQHSVRESKGSVNPYVNFSDLAWFEFALPPIEEQQRMVSALSATTNTSEALFRLASAVESAEQALLRQSFGDSYARPSNCLPLVELSQLAEVRTGLAKGRSPDDSTMTMPYLAVSNVKDGYLDLTTVKNIVVERERAARYALETGDVLMTEGGDLDKLGRGTVWQGEIPGCLHQNHIFAVRVDSSRLEPWYLAALARSPYGRSYFLASAKRSSNLASVNKAQVSAFRVPLMTLDAQRNWLGAYHALREQQSRARERMQHVSAIIEGVMNRGEDS